MIKVESMPTGEMQALLLRVGFGHLGRTRDDHPYVVPMHYAYDGEGPTSSRPKEQRLSSSRLTPVVCF